MCTVGVELSRLAEVPVFALDDRRLHKRLTTALQVKAHTEELIARLVREVDDRGLAQAAGCRRRGRICKPCIACHPVRQPG